MNDFKPSPGSGKSLSFQSRPLTYLLIIILFFLVFMGFFNRFFFAPKILLLLLTILLAVFLGKLELFYKDWFVFLSFIYLFDTMRGIIYILTCRLNLPVHMLYVIKGEQFLFGEVPSAALQKALLDPNHFTWFEKTLTIIHGTHFIAFLGVGLLIWLHRRQFFPAFKKAFYAVIFLGVLGYGIIPTAPPWIASKFFGVLPNLLRFNAEIYNMSIPDITSGFNTNPIAAMPSLHTAFPVLCSFILWKLYRWKAVPFIAYTLTVIFTIIYTGDHYVLDILAGSLLAFLCFVWAFKKRTPHGHKQASSGKATSLSPRFNAKKTFLIGVALLSFGIIVGLYNKNQFHSSSERYNLQYAPNYIDFLHNQQRYQMNFKVQMYFGNHSFLKKDYKKALFYYKQAGKAARQFSDERLAELKINQIEHFLNEKK